MHLHKLVIAITNLCVSMGARVVAEGVETVEEYDAVREAGVEFVQGYFFAKPQFPPPEVDADAVVADARS